MFGLPASTKLNRDIPKNKLFSRALTSSSLRDVYDEQIESIVWRNKLSRDTYEALRETGSPDELEILEVNTRVNSVDKRLLRQLDRTIPYYTFFVLSCESRRQAWIANKAIYTEKIRIENYIRTMWLEREGFHFTFSGGTASSICASLKEQVAQKRSRGIIAAQQEQECDALITLGL